MKRHRLRATAILFAEGGFNFFITITVNNEWPDLKEYLEKIWNFRHAIKPDHQTLVNYDVSASCNFIHQKFKAIKALLTSKKPSLWSPGKSII